MSEFVLNKQAESYKDIKLHLRPGSLAVPVSDYIHGLLDPLSGLLLPVPAMDDLTLARADITTDLAPRRMIVEGEVFRQLGIYTGPTVDNEGKVLVPEGAADLSVKVGSALDVTSRNLYFGDRLLYVPATEAYLTAWDTAIRSELPEVKTVDYSTSFILSYHNYANMTAAQMPLSTDNYFQSRMGYFTSVYGYLLGRRDQARAAQKDQMAEKEAALKAYQEYQDLGDMEFPDDIQQIKNRYDNAVIAVKNTINLLSTIQKAASYGSQLEEWSAEPEDSKSA